MIYRSIYIKTQDITRICASHLAKAIAFIPNVIVPILQPSK